MRTQDFSQIILDAIQYSGNDRNNITPETFAQFRDFAHARLREAWETVLWTDICRIAPFTATLDSNSVNTFTPDPNAAEIVGVWNNNPQNTTRAKNLDYQLYDNGTGIGVIISNIVTTGYYMYRLKCPNLVGDAYDPTLVYFQDAQCYFDSGSGTGTLMPMAGKPYKANLYNCVVNSTTVGQNPNNSPSSWQIVQIPYVFAPFMSWGAAAAWCASEGLLENAQLFEAKAKELLEQEYDKLLRQQGQFGKILMDFTY